MLVPIIACPDPYAAAKEYEACGWTMDFSQPPESGDPLVGVSLYGNRVLLGVTEGYVPREQWPHIGAGVEFYIVIPPQELENTHKSHRPCSPGAIRMEPWGVRAFEAVIASHKYRIAAEK